MTPKERAQTIMASAHGFPLDVVVNQIAEAIEQYVAAEREACASECDQLAEETPFQQRADAYGRAARIIRARSNS